MTLQMQRWKILLAGAAMAASLAGCMKAETASAPMEPTPVSTDSGAATPSPEVSERPTNDPAMSAKPADGVALPVGYEIVSNVLLPAETYLPKGDRMPTGVVLLDARERARNDSVCAALLGARTATVRTEAEARRDDPSGDYLVTHWLVRSAVANEADCAALTDAYDFDRAKRIKATYSLDARRGPIFLALDATGEMVFLDLSDATREDVFKATSDWMQLALTAPQAGPQAGRPPRPAGLVAGANQLFARIASGFGSLARADSAPISIPFNDPSTGVARSFTIYRSGVYLIGATFLL
jgi:hypothetical protein